RLQAGARPPGFFCFSKPEEHGMPMVKTIVRKGFRHEGTYLQPGQALELPSIEFNHYANRGLVAEDKAKEAVDPPKQTYSRRDMRAQKVRAKVMSTQAAETEQ